MIETNVPGIKPGDIGESEAAVVRTTADGRIELVGRILLADWPMLAAGASSTTTATPQHGAPAGYAAPSHGGAPVAFPDSPVGWLTQEYLRAFSTGDTATMHKFIESSLEADSARSTVDRLAGFAKLFGDMGQLHVASLDSVSEHEIIVTARATRGDVHVTVKESAQQPGRAASITFRYEGH